MSLFNQAVNTPRGKATYIAPVWHIEIDEQTGEEKIIHDGVQVARHAPVTEMTDEQLERAHPSVKDMDRDTRAAWLKSAKYLVNEIYLPEEVTPCNT